MLAELAGHDQAERRRVAVAEVVGAVDRGVGGEPERERLGLLLQVVLAEELDRPIVGAVDADLAAGHDADAELHADHRARVEAEEVGGEAAEARRRRAAA